MASLQPRRVRGHTYWYIVESRRVNGKPRPVPIAYLGKADDLLVRLQAADVLRLRSHAHGAVAALWAVAESLDIAGIIDRQLLATGRRVCGRELGAASPQQAPAKSDGLTVGQSLTLACIGRACHAASKRGFAEWARTTTLGELAGADVERLTSQHFWDQMDQVPVESIAPIERVMLITDQDQWSTTDIIEAYHGQSGIEAVFAHLKDPMHLALRPQFHWTDQKLHVHVFTCILGYLLARTLFLRATRLGAPYASMESMLEALAQVRRITVARSATGKGRMRITKQLEGLDTPLAGILPALGVKESLVYTP